MERYIDADAVVWEIEKDKCGLEDYDSALDVAIAEIKTFKTADVIEVVRCEECRYWENRFDVMVCNLTDGMKGASDYCSFGEGREDAEIH